MSTAKALHIAAPGFKGGPEVKLFSTTVQGWLLPVHRIPDDEEPEAVASLLSCICAAVALFIITVWSAVHVTVPLRLAIPVLLLIVPLSIVRFSISANAELPIPRRADVAMRVNLFTFILLQVSIKKLF
jgi:hypothetical protein